MDSAGCMHWQVQLPDSLSTNVLSMPGLVSQVRPSTMTPTWCWLSSSCISHGAFQGCSHNKGRDWGGVLEMQIPWLPQASLMLQLAIRSSPLWQGH